MGVDCSAGVKRVEIGKKQVYFFESHHYALIPWAMLRSQMNHSPILLSLDHHTDTHSPFLHSSYNRTTQKLDEEYVEIELKKIDFKNLNTIESALSKLRNDEHIKTAIETDIINKAFIISHSNMSDEPLSSEEDERISNHMEIMMARIQGETHESEKIQRPFHYPEKSIYIPSIYPLDDEIDYAVGSGHEIESSFLADKFQVFSEMVPNDISNNLINKKYILDIDMDYFHAMKSLNPSDVSVFSELVRNAEIITIAREKIHIEMIEEEYNLPRKSYNKMEEAIMNLLENILEV